MAAPPDAIAAPPDAVAAPRDAVAAAGATAPLRNTVGSLAVRLLLAFTVGLSVVPALAFTIAQPWYVRGHSMEPSLEDGSMLLVDALGPRVGGYARGDIVIVPVPPVADYEHPVLVKRIVGVSGDRVRIANGLVWINGQRTDEPYLAPGTRTPTGGGPIDVVVPRGSVFVMGDQRANSFDSKAFGPIPASSLMGRAWLAVAPGGEMAVELQGVEAGTGR